MTKAIAWGFGTPTPPLPMTPISNVIGFLQRYYVGVYHCDLHGEFKMGTHHLRVGPAIMTEAEATERALELGIDPGLVGHDRAKVTND